MCAIGGNSAGSIGGAMPTTSILGPSAIGGAAARAVRRPTASGSGTLLTGAGPGVKGSPSGGVGTGGAKPRPPVMAR